MSIENDSFAQGFGFPFVKDGGVTTPAGFKASGVDAGIKADSSKPDLALLMADEPCPAAGVFTQNVFCAAPVRFCKEQFEKSSGSPSYGTMQAMCINSGIANAATGQPGLDACLKEAELVADQLAVSPDDVLIASTGVIGVQLPIPLFEQALPQAADQLSVDGGANAAVAIMTTDLVAKECAVEIDGALLGFEGETFHVGGMAKGSGMIMPNMATMIAVLTTDVPVKSPDLHALLKEAVGASFNKITVDSDTSTNDTCVIFASGAGASDKDSYVEPGTEGYDVLRNAIKQVACTLARAMARDGEGATMLINVNVHGAASAEDADLAARTVANSPLVKTAFAGHDANWGRIAAAIGRSGAKFSQECVDIDILGIPVCRGGLTIEFDEEEALKRFEQPEVSIDVNLGEGEFETTVWTCDLTHDYIIINADYRN